MKRKLIASILGIAASSAMVASSYGQGLIIFANYAPSDTGSPSSPVTFGNGPAAGDAVNSAFTAELLYSYAGMTGGTADGSTGFDYAQNSTGGIATASIINPTVAPITSTFNVNTAAYPQGYLGLYGFSDPVNSASNVVIPGYSSGTVTFEVYVSGTYLSTLYTGTSSSFTAPSLATLANNAAVGDLYNGGTGGLTGMTVSSVVVPEPTTLALAGLGMASLLVIRRRK